MLRRCTYYFRESYVLNRYELVVNFEVLNSKGRLEPIFSRIVPELPFSYNYHYGTVHVFPFKVFDVTDDGSSCYYITYEFYEHWSSCEFMNQLDICLNNLELLRVTVGNFSGYGGGELRFFPSEGKFLRFYEDKWYDDRFEEDEEDDCYNSYYSEEEYEED